MGREKKTAVEKKPGKRKPRRKRCAGEGCQKLAPYGSIFCEECAGANDGPSSVEKVTELEALRFAKLDTEARNDNQALEILNFKMAAVRQRAELELSQLQMQKRQLQASMDARKAPYESMVLDLAERYGIKNPSQMTIDPETCVIRDLSKT